MLLDKTIRTIFKDRFEIDERNCARSFSAKNFAHFLYDTFIEDKASLNLSIFKDEYSLKKSTNIKLSNESIQDKARCEYYSKLISGGSWTKKPLLNTITILDWDDTLLCTSQIAPKGWTDEKLILNSKQMKQISELENYVISLLKQSISSSDVYILTNAFEGWVELSCSQFFPNAFELLNQVQIVSARHLYEKTYTNDKKRWKIEALHRILLKYDRSQPTNIINLGNSYNEIEAGIRIAKQFANGVIKSIKLKETPTIEELIKQHKLIKKQLASIISSAKSLKVTIEKKE